MNRKMRRFKQELPEAMAKDVLTRNGVGILALNGDEGYPYGVPVNYVYADGAIYFHSAVAGYKNELIEKDGKTSFTVIDKATNVPENVTTYFRSVIVTGKVHLVTDEVEKRKGLDYLWQKFCPEFEDKAVAEIISDGKRTAMFKVVIEELRGKEAIELVREREGK